MNKFNIRTGLLSRDFVSITGSLYVTAGITGSANTASFANTASYSVTATTASFVTLVNSASYSFNSLSSSFADVAEYSPLAGTGSFIPPYVSGSGVFQTGSFLNPNIYGVIATTDTIFNVAPATYITQSLILAPIKITKDCILKDISHFCQLGAISTASVAIYTNTDKMLPGNKIYQGTISGSSGFGYIQYIPTSSIILKNNNIYWIGYVTQNNSSTPYRIYRFSTALITVNKVINPLLGVAEPTGLITNYIQNITHYIYNPPITNVITDIPNVCSQEWAQYTPIAGSSEMPVLPFIRIE